MVEKLQREIANCLAVHPTLAGRHQQNLHAAKPNKIVAPQRKTLE